jgi:hypothetical protein
MGSRAATLSLTFALLAACAVILWQRRLLLDLPALAQNPPTHPAPARISTRTVTVTNYVTNLVTVQNVQRTDTHAAASVAGGRQLWRKLETTDYQDYIANLRSIGCPEQTIRDIVIADVNKLFAARKMELTTGGKVLPFWEAMGPEPDRQTRIEMAKQLAAMDKEKTRLVRDLLGVDLATELRKNSEGDVYPWNRLGFLSPDKQDQVSVLREAFNEQWPQVSAEAAKQGKSAEAIALELQRLDQKRLADLARILTPEELRAHELQTSWTAIQLRNRLAAIKPSESEFLAIYELQKAYDDHYVHYGAGRTEEQKAAARLQVEAQIRLALGEVRYDAYRRTQPKQK